MTPLTRRYVILNLCLLLCERTRVGKNLMTFCLHPLCFFVLLQWYFHEIMTFLIFWGKHSKRDYFLVTQNMSHHGREVGGMTSWEDGLCWKNDVMVWWQGGRTKHISFSRLPMLNNPDHAFFHLAFCNAHALPGYQFELMWHNLNEGNRFTYKQQSVHIIFILFISYR